MEQLKQRLVSITRKEQPPKELPGPAPAPPHELESAHSKRQTRPKNKGKGPATSPSLQAEIPKSRFWMLNGQAGKPPTNTTQIGSTKIDYQHDKSNGYTRLGFKFGTNAQKCFQHSKESVGTMCEPLGKYHCWQITGPADEQTRELGIQVRELLEEYHEEIQQGENPKKPLSANIYMVGKSETTAIPTVLISGRENPRKKVLNLLREKNTLRSFNQNNAGTGLKVLLGSSDRPPIWLRQAASATGSKIPGSGTHSHTKVFYNKNATITLGYAVQLYIQHTNTQGERCITKSTLACILTTGVRHYAWTAGHAFLDPSEHIYHGDDDDSGFGKAVEFEFDEEYSYEQLEKDLPDSEDTPPGHSSQAGTSTSNTPGQDQINSSSPHGTTSPSQSKISINDGVDSDENVLLEEFGFLHKASFDVDNSSKDWALIGITAALFKTASVNAIINAPMSEPLHPYRELRLSSKTRQIEVSLITTRGILNGQLSTSSVFINIPPNTDFQEFWIVMLGNGEKIEKGDCGCLAVGSNGVVYGHLVSGDLARGVGHIIPVAPTFQEMMAQTVVTLKIASEQQFPSRYISESSTAFEVDDHSHALSVEVSAGPTIQMTQLDMESEVSRPPPTQHRTDEKGNRSRRTSQIPPTKTSNKPSGISQSLGMKNKRLFRPLRLWGSSAHQSVRQSGASPTDVTNSDNAENIVVKTIDQSKFDNRIFLLVGIGIFGASYALSVSNAIMPALAFIYWPAENSNSHASQIRLITLAGVIVGALCYGYASDRWGRRQIYGSGLGAILISSLGTVQASAGFNNATMSFLGWFLFWRLTLGFGIGAVFVSAAVITSEFAPTKSRAKIMAKVFLMQPLGQLVVWAVSLIVLVTIGQTRGLDTELDTAIEYDKAAVTADIMWRLIVGVGAVPTLVGFMLRATIPESFRYVLGTSSIKQITYAMNRFYAGKRELPFQEEDQRSIEIESRTQPERFVAPIALFEEEDEVGMSDTPWPDRASPTEGQTQQQPGIPARPHQAFSSKMLQEYFIGNGNWRQLASILLCGFFLNIAFSLLGTSDLQVLNKVWTFSQTPNTDSTLAEPESNKSGADLYNALFNGATHSLATVSAAAVVGSLLVIIYVSRFRRRQAFALSSIAFAFILILTGVFVITGIGGPAVVVALYIVCNFVFNLGPSMFLFLIPTEILPTRYRGTGYGIALACSTSGTLIGEVINQNFTTNNSLRTRGFYISTFSVLALLAALLAIAWLPNFEVRDQYFNRSSFSTAPERNVQRTLEYLSGGRFEDGVRIDSVEEYGREEEQVGFRRMFKRLKRRMRN